MNSVNLMVSITNREELPDLTALFERQGIPVQFVSLGRGTAFIESTPKAVTYSFVTEETWRLIKHELETEMEIDLPNKGIVFTIPLSSIVGMKQLRFLLGDQTFEKGEESVLKDTKYELVIIIVNAGNGELIMQAAKEGGANGGTMVHAKGTEKGSTGFFGVTLAAENEMIYTVVKRENRNSVMEHVMKQCELNSKVEAVVFSLPVTSTAGMRFYEMKEEVIEERAGEGTSGEN